MSRGGRRRRETYSQGGHRWKAAGREEAEGRRREAGGYSQGGHRWKAGGREAILKGEEAKMSLFFMIDAISNDRFGELIQFSI